MSEIVMMVLSIGFLLFVGIIMGYAFATRSSLMAIENVNNWINSTEANHWIEIGLYNDLEYKYENLMKEYEQYKGTMKAMQDLGIYKRDDEYEEESEDMQTKINVLYNEAKKHMSSTEWENFNRRIIEREEELGIKWVRL